jgi:hypothetical protein
MRGGEAAAPSASELRSFDLLLRYMMNSKDGSSALTLAEEDLAAAVSELLMLAEPYDAFDVLELIYLRNTATANPGSYGETGYEGNALVVELTALVLGARGMRQGSLPGENGHRADARPVLEQVQAAAEKCFDIGSMFGFFLPNQIIDPMARIRRSSVLREIYFLHTLPYPHMVEDTLDALFNDPAIEEDCRSAAGATATQIRAVLSAALRLRVAAWRERLEPFGNLAQAWRPGTPMPGTLGEHLEQAFHDPGDASVLDLSVLAAESRLELATVQAVVDLFTLDLTGKTPLEAVRDFFRGDSLLRTRPILRDADGHTAVIHGALVLHAIRDRIEEELKRAGLAARYSKRRGQYLESAALALLTASLPDAIAYQALQYFVPDPEARVQQTDPAAFTKLVEADGLLLIDDVAIIIEAKAGALTPLSRTGHSQRLRGDLGKIVTAAADQAARLRDRIVQDQGLRLRDGSWLDLRPVQEIHAIAVSLEDLSGMVTLTADLVYAGLLTGPYLPWTVSLHDLRVISEVVARPAELLLYLRRRTAPDVTLKYQAIDELHLFLHMYRKGLHVEPHPELLGREQPQPSSVGDRGKYAPKETEMVSGRVAELDAWYLSQLGIRSTPALRPRLNADPALLELVDALAANGEPGWLSTAVTLLEGSVMIQQQWAGQGLALARQSAQDGQPHCCTVIAGDKADTLLIWASQGPGQPAALAEQDLRGYLAAKMHQKRLTRGAAMLFDTEGRFIRLISDSRSRGQDPALAGLGQ